jgi:hypothetical protein
VVPFYTREIPYQTGQAQEITITVYESNPDLEGGLFDPPEEGARDYEFAAGSSSEDMSFEFIGLHLFIPVTVQGKERLWVLDTGAGMTVVEKAFAEEIGLDIQEGITGRGAGGTVQADFAVLPPYELEGIRFKEQTVAVIDMDELVRRLGVDIAGILGFDFLSRFVTKVDYANETVSFYEPESFEYAGDGRPVDVHIEESVFETSATLDGKHSGTWLFDLGAGATHIDGIYALREGYSDKDGVLAMGHGAGHEYQLKGIKSDSLEFAGYTVYDPAISFHYGGTDTVFTADRIGVLGNTLFRNFVLYLDYARERVIVEKGDMFNQDWPEDRSGLGVGWTSGRDAVEVLYVSPDTPASKSGFVKGDIIRKVNGSAIHVPDGALEVRELLKKEPGTTYDIVVERSGREMTLGLELEDLY